MKDVEDNNVYLALDNHKSDEFVLKQNLAVLIANKNATLESVAQEIVSIPAALLSEGNYEPTRITTVALDENR